MSLTKLFDFKYLLQNIKKSKMAITLFFIIVPIFTSLMIIASEEYVFEYAALASINIVGMYIIPFIFSFCLFGYVFKKNSVDFMGSMPISRKCIFITNTIGGIALIVLLQLITFVLSILLGFITDNTIFTSMAFDVLIYQTISYIFMFTIADLAMSVSGNVLTQIVVTILITFLIPFSSWYIKASNGRDDYRIIDYGTNVFTVTKLENYTAPSSIFSIADTGEFGFNKISIYKMIALIIIYFTLGLIAFNKRKMEIAGESFDNKYIHFIVKGLTLAPFVAILIEIGDSTDFSVVAIILAIIAVYYFVYDLITAKKMKVRENIVGLVFSVLALVGTYTFMAAIDEGFDKKFEIDEIKTMVVQKNDEFKFTITDKEKIKNVVALASNNISADYYSGKGRARIYIEVTKYGGSKYYRKVYVPTDKLSEILVEPFKNITVSDKAVINNRYFKVTDEEAKNIKIQLNESLKNMTYAELVGITRSNGEVSLYEYRDHELVSLSYPINISDEVANGMMKAYNKYAYEFIQTGYYTYYYNIDFHGNVNDELVSKLNISLNYCDSLVLSDFIRNNYNLDEKDYDKCALIYSSDFRFYTDKIDALVDVLTKVYNENKEKIDNEYNNYYVPQYEGVKYDEVITVVPESVEVIY